MFKELTKLELYNIYVDYCLSKAEGKRCESLVPYAEAFKEKLGTLMSLKEAIDHITIIFLEEIANKYFG